MSVLTFSFFSLKKKKRLCSHNFHPFSLPRFRIPNVSIYPREYCCLQSINSKMNLAQQALPILRYEFKKTSKLQHVISNLFLVGFKKRPCSHDSHPFSLPRPRIPNVFMYPREYYCLQSVNSKNELGSVGTAHFKV